MIQILTAVLAIVLVAAAMAVGVGSTTPDAVTRQGVEAEGVVGYGAIRSAADAYAVANRGAAMADDAFADLAGYMPLPPRMPAGLAWSARGGAAPWACASGVAPSRPEADGLRRLATRLGGTVSPACGVAGDVVDGGAVALTVPLSPN